MNEDIKQSISEILKFARMVHRQRRSLVVDPTYWPADDIVKGKLKEASEVRNMLVAATPQIQRDPFLQNKLTFHAFLIEELSKFIVEAKQVISTHSVYKEGNNIVLEDAAGNKYIALYFTPLPEDDTEDSYELYVKDYNYRNHPEPQSYNQAVFSDQNLLKRYPYIFTIRLNFRAVLQVSNLFDKQLTQQALEAARTDYINEQREKKSKHEREYN